MAITRTKLTTLFASCLYILSAGFPVLAADIDMYVGGGGTTGSKTTNVLFIIDNSGSMQDPPKDANGDRQVDDNGNLLNGLTDADRKTNIVKSTLEKLLYDPDDLAANPNNPTKGNPKLKGLNFAIMKFNKNDGDSNTKNGGLFALGFTELQDDIQEPGNTINRVTKIVGSIKGVSAEGGTYTPLAETLYEATRFYLGMSPLYGANSTVKNDVAKGGNYTPPLTGQCGVENHVVLLTDGMPTNDSNADSHINGLPGGFSDGNKLKLAECASSTPDTATNNDCLPLVSEYLFKNDFDKDPNNGVQNVITHTIAFDINASGTLDLLNNTATDCEEQETNPTNTSCTAYTANNAMSLTTAFEQILTDINQSTTTMTNAAVSISSQLDHENKAYFGLFQPAMTPRWKGNLKGYQILDTADPGKIGKDYYDYDAPPKTVLNAGTIRDDAVSEWGMIQDGSDISLGGAEGQMPATRNVYTYTGGANSDIDNPLPLEALNASNTNLTPTMFNAANAQEKDDLIRWALGEEPYDDDGDPNTPMAWRDRHVIGDPLHSQPVIVNYKDGNGDITSYAFFGTNDSTLHAVNVATGEEAFAFIPQELLPNLKILMENPEMTPLDRPYGLDGDITVGKIDGKLLLFFGMRRGGSNYYTLDVSDINNPKYVWKISGGPNGASDFTELGQTWAKPLFAKVGFADPNGNDKIVLIIGGGYDEIEDDAANLSGSTVGRAVYIVDATNGNRLWWAHGTSSGGASGTRTTTELVIDEMSYSIPSSIAALDLDYDDVVDRLYFVDIAGQLFRIDLDALKEESSGTGTTVVAAPNGGRIANLRGSNPDEQRRFYNEPEIVFNKYGAYKYISINVGSGYRANPLTTGIRDRFYSVRDGVNPVDGNGYVTITESDLYDATSTHSTEDIVNNNKGWYINLVGSGEKSLSQSMTINGRLMFTTYTPSSNMGNSCEPPTGTAKFYMVDLYNADPHIVKALDRGGIPPSPQPLIFPGSNNSNPSIEVAVGLEFIKFDSAGGGGGGDETPPPIPPFEPVLNKNFWQEI